MHWRTDSIVSAERIALAHSEPVFRFGTKIILERAGFEIIAEVSSADEAVRIVNQTNPDLLLTGAVFKDGQALDIANALRGAETHTKLILISEPSQPLHLPDIVAAGFLGCVESSHEASVLITAIQDVINGAAVYWCSAAGRGGIKGSRIELSPRERQVLVLLANGVAKKRIAAQLGISIRTVEAHRASIMEKLDIHSIAGLVRFAVNRGMLEP